MSIPADSTLVNINTISPEGTPKATKRQPRERRKRLTAERRAKIRDVRRQGACLRCKMLRIACSKENPCESCLSSAVRGSERKVLSFCYCVRTRFVDVDIFANDDGVSGEIGDDVTKLLSHVIDGQCLDRTSTCFEEILVEWLKNPGYVMPHGSIISTLISTSLAIDIEEVLGADMAKDFRAFLFSSSLARTQWGWGGWSCYHLGRAAQISGSRIIRRLDHFLTPQFIAKLSRDASRVVFLFVLGLVLGVGYFGDSMEVLGSKFRKSPTLWLTMREHICQMLAHHLIFIGSTIGIKLDTSTEQAIIDGAVGRWRKAEIFGWARQRITGSGAEPLEKNARADSHRTWANGNFVTIPCDDIMSFHDLDLGSEAIPAEQRYEEASSRTDANEVTNPDYYSTTEDFDWESFSPPPIEKFPEASVIPDTREVIKTEEAETSERPKLEERHDSGVEAFPYRRRSKRSVWLVRPFDAGGDAGMVSVHARYGVPEGQALGLFA